MLSEESDEDLISQDLSEVDSQIEDSEVASFSEFGPSAGQGSGVTDFRDLSLEFAWTDVAS